MEENYQNPNQPQFQQQNFNNNFPQQLQLPNASTVLVLGIISIVVCCFFIGVILGIIALIMASKSSLIYNQNPSLYSTGSYNNLVAGKVCAVIGLIVSALVSLYQIFWLILYGTIMSSIPWDRMN